MPMPIEITFADSLDASEFLRTRIEREAAKLEKFSRHILACRVAVEKIMARHHQGNLFKIRVHVTLAGGKEVVIDRDAGLNHAHEDAFVAARDAFAAARRRLQDRERRTARRGKAAQIAVEA
jgi:ribosome-associated translation inhibitor RaiA